MMGHAISRDEQNTVPDEPGDPLEQHELVKYCPLFSAGRLPAAWFWKRRRQAKHPMERCIGVRCGFWSHFHSDCAISVLGDMARLNSKE